MSAVGFGLASALVYGVADVAGGLATRRQPSTRVSSDSSDLPWSDGHTMHASAEPPESDRAPPAGASGPSWYAV